MTWICTVAFVLGLLTVAAFLASLVCHILGLINPYGSFTFVGAPLIIAAILLAILAGIFHGVGNCPPRAPCQIEREVNTP